MTSIGEIYDHFVSQLIYKADELDFAYAIEDTMAQYNIAEDDVRYIVTHIERSLFSD